MYETNSFHHRSWIVATSLFFAAALPACPRPVLLELFTSSSAANCRSAEQAVAKLRLEFSVDELHLLVYQMNNKDPDWTFEGAVRALECSVKTAFLPVAIFNGVSRIDGPLPDLYPSYRELVIQKKQGEALGEFQCWTQLSAASVVAAATFQLPLSTPAHDLDMYFAVAENRSPDLPGVIIAFQYVDTIDALMGNYVLQIDRLFTLKEVKTEGIWWIEDSVSREVLHSSRAANIAPFQGDFNGDGEWDGLDIFWLSFLWGTNSNAADIDQDGVVNQSDLLHFLKRNSAME